MWMIVTKGTEGDARDTRAPLAAHAIFEKNSPLPTKRLDARGRANSKILP